MKNFRYFEPALGETETSTNELEGTARLTIKGAAVKAAEHSWASERWDGTITLCLIDPVDNTIHTFEVYTEETVTFIIEEIE